MVGLRKFLSSSAVYFLGNGVNRIIPFFLLPLLTRWLTKTDYGFIGTFNAFRSNVQPVVGLSSAGAINRAYVDRGKKDFDFPSYIFNAVVVNFFLFNFILILVVLLQGVIRDTLHFPPSWVFLVVLISLFAVLSTIKLDLWVYQDRPWSFGFANIFLSVLNVGISIFLLKFLWMDWRGRIVGVALAELIFCLLTLFLLWKEDRPRFRLDKRYMKSVLSFGLPLYPHSLGLMLIATSDKFFLNALLGMEELGVYAVGYTVASLLPLLLMPFDMAASPRIYNMLDKDDPKPKEHFVCFFAIYFLFFLGLSIFLSTTIPLFFKYFVGEKFHGADQYIVWLVMGQFFVLMYRIPSKWINFARKNYHFSWMTFIAGLIAVGANCILIPLNGAAGAAQATLLAYLSMFVLTGLMAQHLYPMPWRSLLKMSVWRQLAYENS